MYRFLTILTLYTGLSSCAVVLYEYYFLFSILSYKIKRKAYCNSLYVNTLVIYHTSNPELETVETCTPMNKPVPDLVASRVESRNTQNCHTKTVNYQSYLCYS